VIHPDWPAPHGVHAVTTLREGGVSGAPFDSFNLADHVGDRPDAVRDNRALLRQRLQLPREPLWLTQRHEDRVVDAATAAAGAPADASFSQRAGVVCAVLTADCLPVLFCDRPGSRVAAAHAGWRGLAGGILERTVQALASPPEQLMAWLGPAIGPHAFEVGDEVRDAFVSRHAQAAGAFVRSAGGRWLADLYRLARVRLVASGVSAVYGGGFCTFNDAARFYSYRRDHRTGRMATLIWLS
jgi:YfiH family protein